MVICEASYGGKGGWILSTSLVLTRSLVLMLELKVFGLLGLVEF